MRRMFSLVALPMLMIAAPAQASPGGFPDVDALTPVAPDQYKVSGAHPSSSGWSFSTPGGLRCQDSLIAELGVACWGPVPGAPSGSNFVTVSLTHAGRFEQTTEADADGTTYPLLPVGSKLAADNGVVCAVLTSDSLACRAQKPAWWAPDTADPPDRHYGEHGFVVAPEGSWTY